MSIGVLSADRSSGVLRDYSIPDAEAAQLRAYFDPAAPGATQEAPALSMDRNAPVRVPAA